jgi:hypothetical protein
VLGSKRGGAAFLLHCVRDGRLKDGEGPDVVCKKGVGTLASVQANNQKAIESGSWEGSTYD